MHTRRSLLVLALVAVLVFVLAVPATASGAPVRKIVQFRAGFLNAPGRAAVAKHHGVVIKQLPLVDGAAVYLPTEAAAKALSRELAVARVDDDVVVHAIVRPSGKPTSKPQPSEATQWGVTAVGAPDVWATTTADNVKVGVIDTGIDLSHPDLAANIKGSVNCIVAGRSADDDNGHGTHVAGIIAALDNEIGVVGVAPAADLYAIKVLDRRGNGYLSDVIEGMDWAKNNGVQVVNMSLGTQYYNYDLDLATQRLAKAGVVQVAAAGNDNPNPGGVDYPGALSDVIAVAAVDSNDTVASWSSRGSQVAIAAPGVGIYSTYKGDGYNTLSGTSMATPHVTGVVALMLSQPDPDGDGWEPAEVRARLTATALPLGAASAYGAGLAQAGWLAAP